MLYKNDNLAAKLQKVFEMCKYFAKKISFCISFVIFFFIDPKQNSSYECMDRTLAGLVSALDDIHPLLKADGLVMKFSKSLKL